MTAPRFKAGDRVQSGEPGSAEHGSAEHDTGTVRRVTRAHAPGVHGYRVAWDGAGEEYDDEEDELQPYTQETIRKLLAPHGFDDAGADSIAYRGAAVADLMTLPNEERERIAAALRCAAPEGDDQ